MIGGISIPAGSARPRMNQLLNHVIDEIAAAEPDSPCLEIPVSEATYELGFRSVTRQQFASAVNGAAWWLEESLGRGRDFQTLAYFGPWDVRYNILLFAAVKVGYKMFFPSPQYSASGAVPLLQDLGCKTLLVTKDLLPLVPSILEIQEFDKLEVHSAEHMLAANCPRYPYEKTFEEAYNEPLVVLHTSGTTGYPKPIVWTHGWAASFLKLRAWDDDHDIPSGFILQDSLMCGKRVFSFFPPWSSGNLFVSFRSLVSPYIHIWPISSLPPSAHSMISGLRYNNVDIVCTGPAIVEGVAQDSGMLDILASHVEQYFWAGGGISDAAGQALASRMRFYQAYGSAESGMAVLLQAAKSRDADEWKYIRPHPEYGMEFRHHTDNLFEAFLVHSTDPTDDPTVFVLYPHLKEMSTQDIFSPHPVKPGLWCYHSRIDDVLVFDNGHKFNPGSYEKRLVTHPEINAALMVGTRRPCGCLILEHTYGEEPSSHELDLLLDRIWPTITQANEPCTLQAKIKKSHILFASSAKPLPRTDKGSIKRVQALQLYEEELNSIYASELKAG